jgi:hypothetical protein
MRLGGRRRLGRGSARDGRPLCTGGLRSMSMWKVGRAPDQVSMRASSVSAGRPPVLEVVGMAGAGVDLVTSSGAIGEGAVADDC